MAPPVSSGLLRSHRTRAGPCATSISWAGRSRTSSSTTTNNMGAETEVQYAASTKFYLQDRLEGRPWVTKLPFPVHVIERVENRDLVSNTKLVSTYRYRHGYYDGVEREFRGFAHVEQRDAESVVGEFDLPPVVTKTWFHNGAFLEGGKLEAYFKDPANQEYFTGDAQAAFLPDTDLPPDLTVDEMREAARALKGSILRQEVYADDGSAKASLPYSVSERSYKLTCLQPQGPNRHAVFFSHPSETIDYHYERNPADPRISHALTLAVDDYGNVLKSVAIGYQRRTPAFDEQKKTLATLTESQYTNAVLEDDAYRTPLPAEVKTYRADRADAQGRDAPGFRHGRRHRRGRKRNRLRGAADPGQTQKRLIEQLRTLYRKNDLSALLPLGKVESMALTRRELQARVHPGPARRLPNQGIARRTDGDPHRIRRRIPRSRRKWPTMDSLRPGLLLAEPRRFGAAGTRLRAGAFLSPASFPGSLRQHDRRRL